MRINDSELYRFAGDAFYYNYNWIMSLLCYEKAVKIEPTEYYFLKEKILFIQNRDISKKPAFHNLRIYISNKMGNFGEFLFSKGLNFIGIPTFYFLTKFVYFLKTPNEYLAFFYNRRGSHSLAVKHLQKALSVCPEDPATRANLALNKYYIKDKIDNEIEEDMKISFFHGDSTIFDLYHMGFIYNPKKGKFFKKIRAIEKKANSELKGRKIRRRKLKEPEKFDDIIHIEF